MNEIDIISNKNLLNTLKLKSLIGKKVLASNGEVIGKVQDIAFDSAKVHGIYTKDLLIDMIYIDEFQEESIILKINPVTSLKGKIVFDKDGKRIGKIIDVVRNSSENIFNQIVVKKYFFQKPIKIPREDMKIIDKNIILNKIM